MHSLTMLQCYVTYIRKYVDVMSVIFSLQIVVCVVRVAVSVKHLLLVFRIEGNLMAWMHVNVNL